MDRVPYATPAVIDCSKKPLYGCKSCYFNPVLGGVHEHAGPCDCGRRMLLLDTDYEGHIVFREAN